MRMAQRVEQRLRQENIISGTHKGKAVVTRVHRTTRVRSALGEIHGEQHKQELPFDKDKTQGVAAQLTVRPRTYTVEQRESDLTKLKEKPVQFVEPRDIDITDADKEYACAEYAKEISQYLKSREVVYQVPEKYIESHSQINQRMRAILVDWLVQVHDKFRLLQETLFLTVSILDRYLAVDTAVQKRDLQLVGVSAMLLASKIEEIYSPEIRDFVFITANAYSCDEIRACESKMAGMLDFNFGEPLCIHFLRRNSKASNADAEKHTLAKYFMELMLPDYESLRYLPSQRAAAALCLAMKITDNSPWDATTAHYSYYQEHDLHPCMKKIAQLVLKSNNKDSKLLSVSIKFSSNKFYKVATSPSLNSELILTLAQD